MGVVAHFRGPPVTESPPFQKNVRFLLRYRVQIATNRLKSELIRFSVQHGQTLTLTYQLGVKC